MLTKTWVAPPCILHDCRFATIAALTDLQCQWNAQDILVVPGWESRRLILGYASSDRALEAVFRLRSVVFTQELGHGSTEARLLGIDKDKYDDQMDHIVLVDRDSHEMVGTYRVQTIAKAEKHLGIYSASEFQIEALRPFFPELAECGRACILPAFRKATSLFTLWAGLSSYLQLADCRWLFGCCSINSVDTDDAWKTMKTLRTLGYLNDTLVPPVAACDCGDPDLEFALDPEDALPLPKLFGAYMKLGARVVSLPAIDRDFGTIDFLVMADVKDLKMSSLSR